METPTNPALYLYVFKLFYTVDWCSVRGEIIAETAQQAYNWIDESYPRQFRLIHNGVVDSLELELRSEVKMPFVVSVDNY